MEGNWALVVLLLVVGIAGVISQENPPLEQIIQKEEVEELIQDVDHVDSGFPKVSPRFFIRSDPNDNRSKREIMEDPHPNHHKSDRLLEAWETVQLMRNLENERRDALIAGSGIPGNPPVELFDTMIEYEEQRVLAQQARDRQIARYSSDFEHRNAYRVV